MAELIDKTAVIKDIASWAIGGNPEEPQMVRIDEIVMLIGTSIEELPTTTEAELRANVIDEFYDEVLNFEDYIEPIEERNGVLLYSGRDITNMIADIKRKLNGEKE